MKKYYLFINGSTVGPMYLSDLGANGATMETFVWWHGLRDWTRIADLPEIAEALQSQLEPRPPQFDPEGFKTTIGGGRSIPPVNELSPRPNNYLAESIVALLFCMPLAIVAIVTALKVNKLYDCGEIERAYAEATEARNWFIASVALGAVMFILALI